MIAVVTFDFVTVLPAGILLTCFLVYHFFSDRIRRRRLRGLAAAGGYSFVERETTDVAPYYENLAPGNPFRRYEVHSVENVIRGEIGDIAFAYFEQTMELADGLYVGRPVSQYSLSVVALEITADRHFDIPPEGYKHFLVKRIGDFIYFQPRKRNLIKTRKLGRALSEIIGLANAATAKPVFNTSE
ncbi:MAG TPA: hypothetical protein VKH81_23655 [Candidatus Angelobacter sp.]|nr:hypothetical protein [Candidatus Angelobacter sp.]